MRCWLLEDVLMGRKPIPTHLKILRGNRGHQALRPELEPVHESAPMVPEPPVFLSADAKAEWRRVATELYHLGLLTRVDEHPFAAYCQAYGRWVAAEKGIARKAKDDPVCFGLLHPLVQVASKACAEMVKYASEFGFTPAARARIAAGIAGSTKSKFGGLIGGRETDAGRQAPRRARYQVHRNPDGAEREGPGEAVSAGDVPEKLDS
jgi:P27 family predicted phage terminase small subunit